MKQLNVEEFKRIRKRVDDILKPFQQQEETEYETEEIDTEALEARIEIAEKELAKIYEELRSYDLSKIQFKEWEDFPWIFESFELEGTGANLDFNLIKIMGQSQNCRLKGCNIINFDFENINFDDESFDEEFRKEHDEYFLSADVSDLEVRKRYYNNQLTIKDAIDNNLTNIPAKKFRYTDKSLIEKIGLEKAKQIEPELLEKLSYEIDFFIQNDEISEETDINSLIISKIEKDIMRNSHLIEDYQEISFVKEKLDEYFIDFGEKEQLKETFELKNLNSRTILYNYNIFKDKKYAYAMNINAGVEYNYSLSINEIDEFTITEKDIEKFYNEQKDIIPVLFKMHIIWDKFISEYKQIDEQEDKINYMTELIKRNVITYNSDGNITFGDIFELAKVVEILDDFPIENISICRSLIMAEEDGNLENLDDFKDIKLTDLPPRTLELAKKLGDAIGNYDFLDYNVKLLIDRCGMDNLIRLNEETNGMIDKFGLRPPFKFAECLKYDHRFSEIGIYAFEKDGPYESFEENFIRLFTSITNRNEMNYSEFRGEFARKHPELYLPEDVPEELAEKFYTRTLKLDDLAENPEWKSYFNTTRVGIALPNKEMQIADNNQYMNIYDYFELHGQYPKEEILDLLISFRSLLKQDFTFKTRIKLNEPVEKVKEYFKDEFSIGIGQGYRYSDELPEEFKKEHPDFFVSDEIPKEIREKIYSKNLKLKDFRYIDNLEEHLKDKNLEVIFSRAFVQSERYKALYKKVGREKFLEYVHKYGEFLKDIDLMELIYADEYTDIENVLKANIIENVLRGVTKYGPDAPEFLRQTHPELFISDVAPEELKLLFYSDYRNEDSDASGYDHMINARMLLSRPNFIPFLEGKNISLSFRSSQVELFQIFGMKKTLEMAKIDIDSIEIITDKNGAKLLERFLNEESKKFAYRELLENGEYTEEQINNALENENLIDEEQIKIRNLYNNKIEKFKIEIIKNPGVVVYYPIEKIEEFNFGEYKELKALSNFNQSTDCRRYMEENLISHIYAFLGYSEAKKLLQLPQMSKEEIDELITKQKEKFDAVYEKKFKLKGNIRVLNTFFEKFDPILPAGKPKFQVYKSINQRLEEGFDGDIYELLEQAFNENNIKYNKEKLNLCISNSQNVQLSEKMSYISEELLNKINETIPENAANKKIIYDNLFYALKDSLSVRKMIDREHIETMLKKEFSRLKEDGTTFYSAHVTSHIPEMMKIIDDFNLDIDIKSVLNLDLIGLLSQEKEKIGNGWIRKALTISDDLSKEQLDELQIKLYGENGHSIEVTKQIELKEKTEEGRKKAFKLLQENDNPYLITYAKAEKMFGGFSKPYSERFADFFVKHKEEILSNPKYYTILAKMNSNFDRIVDRPHNINRYEAGKFTIEELEREINDVSYEGVQPGEYELEYVAKLGGLDAKYFSVAQRLFEEMKQRTYQTIPQVDISRGKYRGRILRIDDPLHLMIGDITTCCQVIGEEPGEGTMIHSATEENGSVFVVEEYDEYGNYLGPIAQSWTWRNGDRICFDNVEIPDTLEHKLKSSKAYEQILQIYQETGRMLLENDKKAMRKLLESGKITQEQYDSLILKEVTMGTGCDDLIVNISPETKKTLKKAKIVEPVEAKKGYDGIQKGITPWIDSNTTQYIMAEIGEEDRKQLGPKSKMDIKDIPLQYTKTREIISRTGKQIHDDICDVLTEMKKRENSQLATVDDYNYIDIREIQEDEELEDIENISLNMNTNEDWFILSINTEDTIRIYDTSIVEGKYSADSQKEIDEKLAIEEFEKSMEQLMLQATDLGKKFECKITDSPKFDMFRKLAEEGIISIEDDGTITVQDREKLKEKIDISNKVIEEQTTQRNIADTIKEDEEIR